MPVHRPSLPSVPKDGHVVAAPTTHPGTQQDQQSARQPLQQASVTHAGRATSYGLISSGHPSESDNVVMPMTDSGEVDRLAVLCHCAYASQFSENPEDIFRYACIDVKLSQPGNHMRDGGTAETQGPFPEATMVRMANAY